MRSAAAGPHGRVPAGTVAAGVLAVLAAIAVHRARR